MSDLESQLLASFIGLVIGFIFTFALLSYFFPAWSTGQVLLISGFIMSAHA